MTEYLAASYYINWDHPNVLAKAKALASGLSSPEAIARKCFEYVRDEINQSWDYQQNPVTCRASDVLEHKTGYCYAKSHLLAALLRANNIPAGLCYQRLTVTDEPPFCLHGLNAIYLNEFGWFRVDPRGDKANINTEFCPSNEKLAYTPVVKGEADLPEIWAEPLPIVTDVLERYTTYDAVGENLPDIPLVSLPIHATQASKAHAN